ncbi:hypothetical protein A2U01_0079033, partial [Trifolium medium]|nr:hypothetical protein [Trifolium medium]
TAVAGARAAAAGDGEG